MMGTGCGGIDANFGSWGSCISSGIGGGSEEFLILIIFAILVYIMYKFNIPTETGMILGVGMLFAMGITFGKVYLNSAIILIPIALGGYLVMAFLKHAGR